jgi:hypothetical protein
MSDFEMLQNRVRALQQQVAERDARIARLCHAAPADRLDVHAALNTYETAAEPGVTRSPNELDVVGENHRRLVAWWSAAGVWVGGCLITNQADAEALARFIMREDED